MANEDFNDDTKDAGDIGVPLGDGALCAIVPSHRVARAEENTPR